MLFCVISNKCIGVHPIIREAVSKLLEEDIKLNILTKYTHNGTSDMTDFYNQIDSENKSDMEKTVMVLSKNIIHMPGKTNPKDEMIFDEIITVEDFENAFCNDDPYIVHCSPNEYKKLYSYVKVYKPREEHYKIYPIYIKSGTEFQRLSRIISEDMDDETIHHVCRLFLLTNEISDSNMPAGLATDLEDAVDYIFNTVKNMIGTDNNYLREWKDIVAFDFLDNISK